MRSRSRARRVAGVCGRFSAVLAAVVVVLLGAGWWVLGRGPVSFESLPERVAQALETQFGHGYDVSVDQATVAWESGGPNLAVSGVQIRDAKGQLVIDAPQAVIGFDPWSLPIGRLVPRDISFVGLAVALTIAPDGTVSISAGGKLPERAQRSTRVEPGDTSFGPGAVLDALLANDGPVAVLERAGVRGGNLRIDDKRRGSITDYNDFDLNYRRASGGEGVLRLAASGPSGRWSATGAVSGAPGAERSLSVETRNLALSDLIGIARPGAVPFQTDMPISARLSLTVGGDGGLMALDGRIDGDKALVLLQDPEAEPIFVDSLSSAFGWDPSRRTLVIRGFDLKAGDTHWDLTGTVTPPGASVDHWQFALASTGSALAGDGPQDSPAVMTDFRLNGRMPIGLGAILIDEIVAKGPDVAIAGSAAVGDSPTFSGFRLNLVATQMPVRKVMAFWPSFIGAEVRAYMLENVVSGTVQRMEIRDELDLEGLKAAFEKKPLPDQSVQLDMTVTDGVMRPAPGMVTLSGIEATGRITGRTAKVAITRATAVPSPGHALVFGQGRFEVGDTTRKPAIAQISFDVAGGADAMVETLRSEALRGFNFVPAELANVKGQVEAKARITLPLQPVLGPKDVDIALQGSVMNLSADGIAGKEKLEAGNLAFTQDKSGLTVKGDAKIGGIPTTIDMAQPAGAPADVTLAMTLDEAARTKRGIKLPGQITGPVDARVILHDPGSPKAQTRIELDLAKASLVDVLPGWTKPAGKPAKASFRLVTDGDATSLEDFSAEGYGGVVLKGALKLSADQGLASAKLTSVKLSPADDFHADLDRQGNVTKAVVRGATFDARPLLKALTTPGGSLSSPGDIDLDARLGTVIGQNGEALSATDLKLALRGGDFKDFRLSGKLGASPVSGQIARLESGGSGIVLESGDAGGALRFTDVYRRMLGGTLLLTLTGSSPQMDGTLVINRFILSNEPALAKSAQASGDSGPDRPNNVSFTKLKAGFSVGGGKLAIRDGTMWGQQVGGTMDGTLDFARDKADLSGTFVPAYGLNNIINQVPVVGPILGGGQHEGLFAVNFRISGKVSQPTLSINPLSAVAPGILRKFFGVFSPDQTGSTGSTPVLRDANR